MLRAVGAHVPMEKLAMHFHDTYGQALVNLYAGMEEGVRPVPASFSSGRPCHRYLRENLLMPIVLPVGQAVPRALQRYTLRS